MLIELDPDALRELEHRHRDAGAAIQLAAAIARVGSGLLHIDTTDPTIARTQPLQHLGWCLIALERRAALLEERANELHARALLIEQLDSAATTMIAGGLALRAVVVAFDLRRIGSTGTIFTGGSSIGASSNGSGVMSAGTAGTAGTQPTTTIGPPWFSPPIPLDVDPTAVIVGGGASVEDLVGGLANDGLSLLTNVYDAADELLSTIAEVVETTWAALAAELSSFVDGCELAWVVLDQMLDRPLSIYTPQTEVRSSQGAPIELAETLIHAEVSVIGTISIDGSYEVVEYPNGVVEVEFRDQQSIGGKIGEGETGDMGDLGAFIGHDNSVTLRFNSRAEADRFLAMFQLELAQPSVATLNVLNNGMSTGSALTELATRIYQGSPADNVQSVRLQIDGAAAVTIGIGAAQATMTASVNNGYDLAQHQQVQRIEARIDVSADITDGVASVAVGGVVESDFQLIGSPGDAHAAMLDVAFAVDGQGGAEALAKRFPELARTVGFRAAVTSGVGLRITAHVRVTFVNGSSAKAIADHMLAHPETAALNSAALMALMATESMTFDVFATTVDTTDLGANIVTPEGSFGAQVTQHSRTNDRHLWRTSGTLEQLFSR